MNRIATDGGWENADGKMRMDKYGWINADGKKKYVDDKMRMESCE